MREFPDENFHSRREAAVRRVADFCFGLPDESHSGVGWVRRQFVQTFGGEQVLPEQSVHYRLRFAPGPSPRPVSVLIEVELTSVADARPILDELFGTKRDDWRRRDIESHLEAASGRRASRKRSPAATVIRALALHYLSRAGGGRRTFDQSWAMYQEWFAVRDPGSTDGWDQSRQREVIARLETEFGSLRAAA